MPERIVTCYACAAQQGFESQVPRGAMCDSCSANLRCCRNCRHYEPGAYNDCREPSAERVVDKESANLCDYFMPADGAGAGGDKPSGAAVSDLEKLFK